MLRRMLHQHNDGSSPNKAGESTAFSPFHRGQFYFATMLPVLTARNGNICVQKYIIRMSEVIASDIFMGKSTHIYFYNMGLSSYNYNCIARY